jgi:hypothetical protein
MIKKDTNISKNNMCINSNVKANIETTSFLKTIESSQINDTTLIDDLKDKQVDEIVNKYLDLKKKINLFWNKVN